MIPYVDTGAATTGSETSGGFWGDDGFTLEDAGTIFDSVGTALGWFGINTSTPETAPPSAGPAGTYVTPANKTNWIWYALGGVVVIIAAIYLFKKYKK